MEIGVGKGLGVVRRTAAPGALVEVGVETGGAMAPPGEQADNKKIIGKNTTIFITSNQI
jgi:hypothetical protein